MVDKEMAKCNGYSIHPCLLIGDIHSAAIRIKAPFILLGTDHILPDKLMPSVSRACFNTWVRS